jgi:hypothetical protein
MSCPDLPGNAKTEQKEKFKYFILRVFKWIDLIWYMLSSIYKHLVPAGVIYICDTRLKIFARWYQHFGQPLQNVFERFSAQISMCCQAARVPVGI